MKRILHQMRPWPPGWTRPMDDRPPYIVWPIGGLVVWAIILAVFTGHHTTHVESVGQIFWIIFAGWCVGVLGASIAHYIYRR